MPSPANWLEELVVEWLEVEGFARATSVIIPAGLRNNDAVRSHFAPDVVGAKLVDGQLLIRHCEVPMYLFETPNQVSNKYIEKFSERVQTSVRAYFARSFGEGAGQNVIYEKWVITCGASQSVWAVLAVALPGARLYMLTDFVANELVSCIKRWRELHPMTTLPADRWLLLGLVN